MQDNGIKAAMLLAFRTFATLSRGTGRTDAMIRGARVGDIILCADETEYRYVRRRLKELGRDGIKVSWSDPKTDPRRMRGTNPMGATIFTHLYIERFWEHRMAKIDEELRYFHAALSKEDVPGHDIHPMAQRVIDHERGEGQYRPI